MIILISKTIGILKTLLARYLEKKKENVHISYWLERLGHCNQRGSHFTRMLHG